MKFILGMLLVFQAAVAIGQTTLAPLEVTSIPSGIPQADPNVSYGGLASLRFGPNGQLYASTGTAVLEQTGGLSGSFTTIGMVPSAGSDPGTLNFYQNGQSLIVSNGAGGTDYSGNSTGSFYSLPVPSGTSILSSVPQATYVGNDSPGGFGTFDFAATPSGSKLFVDAGTASGSEVDLFNPATGASTPIITGIPGASTSVAVSGGYLYVGNGYDYSAAGGGTGQFEMFSIHAMFQALKAGTPLSWNSSTVINGTSGETNSGAGVFIDPRGYLFAGGGYTADVNPYSDIGLAVVSPQGQSYTYAIPSDASGDPMTVVQLSYNAVTNQVLIPGYGPQGNQAAVYSASQFGVAAANLLNWTGANVGGGTNRSWDTTAGSTNWAANIPSQVGSYSTSNYTDGDTVIFGDTNPYSGSLVPNNNGRASVTIAAGGVNPASVMFTNSGAANGGVDYTLCGGPIGGNATIELYGNGMTGGTVTLMSPNGYTGATIVAAGVLNLQDAHALGNSSGVSVIAGAALQLQQSTDGPLTFGLTATGAGSIPLNLYGTGISGGAGALVSAGGNNTYGGAINIGSGGGQIISSSTASGDQLTVSGGVAISAGSTLTVAGPGATSISGAGLTLGNSSAIQIASGTLTISVAGGTGAVSLGSGTVVTVAPTATLQLAGTISALSDPASGNRAAIVNGGSAASGGGLIVAAGNQTVGPITGAASTAGPTTYTGDTTVAAGASLTADQILQNSLTIGDGATVTIAPSSGATADSQDGAVARGQTSATWNTVASDTTDDGGKTASDSLIDLSSVADPSAEIVRLENRIALLERLTTDGAGSAGSELSTMLSSAENSLLSLEAESSTAADGAAGASPFLPTSATVAGGVAGVPEPGTFALCLLAGTVCLSLTIHRRMLPQCREQRFPPGLSPRSQADQPLPDAPFDDSHVAESLGF